MKLRSLNTEQTAILNLLYELRRTKMTPPDPRLSYSGLAKAFGIPMETIESHLKGLRERGFVLRYRIAEEQFCAITLAGIREVEKSSETMIEGELSTSKVGIKGVKRKIIH